MNIPKILFVKRDPGGCGFFRCEHPANYIKKMGLADTTVVQNVATEEQLMNSDLVVMQEMGSPNAASIVQFCLKNKIPYVAEVDDFLQHVSPNNLGGYPAWNPGTLYVHRAMELIRSAVALTVSSNQLAREYFPYNDSIYVVPNYLDKDRWDYPTARRSDGKTRIGWMGGNAHADDLKMVSKVIEKVVKESKGKVLFETFGMMPQELPDVFSLKSIHDVCPSCQYEGEVHHWPGESLDDYSTVLASKGWDLSIAPVINNSFNNCKSDLKIKEYSAVGIPFIASPIVPYKEAAQDGAQMVFAETFDQWYDALKDLIKDPQKRDDMSRANKEWIKRYWIQDNAHKLFEVYKQALEKAALIYGKKKPNLV